METFNASFEKLQHSYALLERRAEAMQRELEEKNRLLDQKTRLELLGQVSASLAHEIRNPLGGLSLYAQQLRRELDGEPGEVAGKIERCVETLNALVSDILTFAGNVDPRRSRQPVEAALDEALDLAGGRVAGVTVVKRYAGVEADFDRAMVQRALLNLVLNAADAMGGAGTLTLTTRDGERAVVEVADTGGGVPEEIMANLFTPFRTGKARGVGLGLAIAKKMIEANGGTLAAANGPEGAVFTVTL